MNLKLKILAINLLTIIVFSSCNYFEKKELNRKRKLKEVAVNKCKKSFSLSNNSSFDEILDSVGHFSYSKQLFVQKNIGKLFGSKLFVDDVFIHKSNFYLSASIGALNSKIVLKITNDQAKEIEQSNPFMESFDAFYIFRLEGIKLLNQKNYFVEDEYIEEGELVDYSIFEEDEIKLLFLGTIVKKCD